jgi:hypothetical protein
MRFGVNAAKEPVKTVCCIPRASQSIPKEKYFQKISRPRDNDCRRELTNQICRWI